MDLYNDIYQLLRKNDCVIIPGFGGFIANYFEAKADLRNQEFYPPSRRVAFNESLQNNDGLLINHLSLTKNISWNSADNYVRKFVNEINENLKKGETVKFDKLGQFTKKTGVLIFVPNNESNFLEDSFGLTGFHFPMLKSSKSVIETQPQPVISKVKPAKNNKKQKSKKPVWASVSIAAAIGGIVFMSFYFGMFDNNTGNNINYTNLVPMEIMGQKAPSTNPETIVEEKNILLENETEPYKDIMAETDQEIESETTFDNNKKILAYTIAGSFASYSNAQNMQKELNDSGFESTILPLYGGLYRVTVKSYEKRYDAVVELQGLREQLNNPNMWVLYMY